MTPQPVASAKFQSSVKIRQAEELSISIASKKFDGMKFTFNFDMQCLAILDTRTGRVQMVPSTNIAFFELDASNLETEEPKSKRPSRVISTASA